jgi:hypothetical protein
MYLPIRKDMYNIQNPACWLTTNRLAAVTFFFAAAAVGVTIYRFFLDYRRHCASLRFAS